MLNREESNIAACIDALDKILEFTKSFSSASDFFEDRKAFDATMMNFVIMGEMVIRISDTFKDKHSEIPWYKIKAFRNIIAHDYFGIDADEVWQIIKNDLPKLKKQFENL